MLKKFFLNTLTSFVGTWLALALFGVVAVMVCIGLLSKLGISDDGEVEVSKGSVLVIDLNGPIEERESAAAPGFMSLLQGDISRPQTLTALTAAISEAKENKKIAGIYLKCNGVSGGIATLNALRNQLLDFKESGKPVVAYGDYYTQGDYYVASVSDKMWLNPSGMVMLTGLGGTNLYLKGLFDKVGVSFQVVKVGTYKSAVEPYINTEMSEPARAQLDTLYGTLWNQVRENIHTVRKVLTPGEIDSLVNGFVFTRKPEYVLKRNLVDSLVYERAVDSLIAVAVDVDVKKLNFIKPESLARQDRPHAGVAGKDHVAVLYATGEIIDGGGEGSIDFNRLVPLIVELADDEHVKGMVLRVNSPGGSAFGSDQIGEALDFFKSKGKPLAVSMGDYAASGGYWISAGADRIFADEFTITGSIGIFGLIPNAGGLISKLGVSPQAVYTNPEADFPNFYQPMTEAQQAAMQRRIEDGYDSFVSRVATGRHMKESKVRTIGEGRVWSATKALQIGLVDQLGSLREAVEWTASKADLGNDYKEVAYPAVEENLWSILPELGGIKAADALQKAMSGNYDALVQRFVCTVMRQGNVMARMPYFKVGFAGTNAGVK